MIKVVFLTLFAVLLSVQLHAANNPELSEILDEVKAGRVDIQNNATVFLLAYKQLEAQLLTSEQNVRIISAEAAVRETDMITGEVLMEVQSGMVLPVLMQTGEWFQVRLDDFRTGWIHQDDVQMTDSGDARSRRSQETNMETNYQTRIIVENYYGKFSGLFKEAEQQMAAFEKIYRSLSVAGQQDAEDLYAAFNLESEIIKRAKAYTDHYYKKLPAIGVFSAARGQGSQAMGFDGVVTARFGSSAFESGGQISETTRNISFTGNLTINPQSKLTLQLNHNNDVIRTPYTTTDVNATYALATEKGTRLRSSLLFQDYRDRLVTTNNFMDVGAHVNVEQPVGSKTRFSGDVQVQAKSYPDREDNNFQGVQINTFIDHRSEKILVIAGIRGRFQSSDLALLAYRRIMPNVRFTYGTGQKNWSLYTEAEQLVYGNAAESGNLTRIRADLERNARGNRNQLSVTSNHFPNNKDYDLLKVKLLRSHNRISQGRSTRSTVYAQYSIYRSSASLLSNYIDLRYDGNFSGRTGYIEIGAFGRYWQDNETDHRLGLYSRLGLKFAGIQIGPVVGAEVYVNTDDPELTRTGNSYRAGIDGRGNFMIRKATVYSSARYQYTWLYSGFTPEGDPVTRQPYTLEITAGTRVPIARLFDFQFDIRYYSIDANYDETGDIMPAQVQSGLRFLAGLSYRF